MREMFNNYSSNGETKKSHQDSYEIRGEYPYKIDDQLKSYF